MKVDLKSLNVDPESLNVDPESLDEYPESLDVDPESLNVHPESLDVHPESLNEYPGAIVVDRATVSFCTQNNNSGYENNNSGTNSWGFSSRKSQKHTKLLPCKDKGLPRGKHSICFSQHFIKRYNIHCLAFGVP